MQNLKQSITTRRIDQILRWAFNLAADRIETKAPRQASKLRSASAHWLRKMLAILTLALPCITGMSIKPIDTRLHKTYPWLLKQTRKIKQIPFDI